MRQSNSVPPFSPGNIQSTFHALLHDFLFSHRSSLHCRFRDIFPDPSNVVTERSRRTITIISAHNLLQYPLEPKRDCAKAKSRALVASRRDIPQRTQYVKRHEKFRIVRAFGWFAARMAF